MKIHHSVAVPEALLTLIREEYEDSPVIDKVYLVPGTDQLEGHMAEYVPETQSVIIDLRECMTNQQWMEKGMAFVPNVWCNLIYTVFHEGIHAEQYANLGTHIDQMPVEELERDADIRSLEKTIDWFGINKRTPSLDELGWVGEQIKALFNGVYAKAHDLVNEEMDLLGTEAGGFVSRAIHFAGNAERAKTMVACLREQESFGIKVGGHLCFKTEDFLELTSNRSRR